MTTVTPAEIIDPMSIFVRPSSFSDVSAMAAKPVWGSDKGMAIRFHTEKELRDAKSQILGREVYEEVEYISIYPDSKTVIRRPVENADKLKYHDLYERFKRRLASNDTEIMEWAAITPNEIKDCVMAGIYTVGQIAGMSDEKLRDSGLGSAGVSLREKARRHEASKRLAADADAQKQEIEKQTAIAEMRAEELAKQKREIEELKKKLEAFAAKVETPKPAKGKKAVKKKDSSDEGDTLYGEVLPEDTELPPENAE